MMYDMNCTNLGCNINSSTFDIGVGINQAEPGLQSAFKGSHWESACISGKKYPSITHAAANQSMVKLSS
jgi:hypothetical protein